MASWSVSLISVGPAGASLIAGCVVRDTHGKATLVDLVEFGVGVPGFVEVDAWNGLGEFGDDLVDVVTESVVGGIGNDGVGGILIGDTRGERALVDKAADEVGREAFNGNEADHAIAVARWLHIDRARARDGEGVTDRLVAVGVEGDDVC